MSVRGTKISSLFATLPEQRKDLELGVRRGLDRRMLRSAPEGRSSIPRLNASKVFPRIWVGAQPKPNAALSGQGISLVVFAANGYQPDPKHFPGVDILYVPLASNHLTQREAELANQAADAIAEHLESTPGDVLITCNMGQDRSALVAGLVMRRLGTPGAEALQLIRERRYDSSFAHTEALNNPEFAEYVEAGRRPARTENPQRGGYNMIADLLELS